MKGFSWAICSILVFASSAIAQQYSGSSGYDYGSASSSPTSSPSPSPSPSPTPDSPYTADEFYLELKGTGNNFTIGNASVFHTEDTATLEVRSDTDGSKEFELIPNGHTSRNMSHPQRFRLFLKIRNTAGLEKGRKLNVSSNGTDTFALTADWRACAQVTDYDIRDIGHGKLSIDFEMYCTNDSSKLKPIKGRLVMGKPEHKPTKIDLDWATSNYNYHTSYYLPESGIDGNYYSYWIGKYNRRVCTSHCYYNNSYWNFWSYDRGAKNEALAYLNVKYYSQSYSPDRLTTWSYDEAGRWKYLGNTYKRSFYNTGSVARVDMDGSQGIGSWIWQYGRIAYAVIREQEMFKYDHNSRWQNAADKHDVDGDGIVDSSDALAVIDHINSNGSDLPVNKPISALFVDVNGDGIVTSLDALIVVNRLPKLWYNTKNLFDVNDDGVLDSTDALAIINELNRNGSHALIGDRPEGMPFFDVSQDGMVSPLDSLRVINQLNKLWYNPEDRFDVNGDGAVTQADAQEVINYLNRNGAGQLSDERPSNQPRIDVNRDGVASSIDALLIINNLNGRWYNSDLLHDVNNDGFVDEADAQTIINDLNRNGARRLSANRPSNAPYLDVTKDGYVTSRDALLVINNLPFLPWHNDRNSCDVNNDGLKTPLDLLLVINRLDGSLFNTRLSHKKPASEPKIDISGDGYFTALDLLQAINCLN